MISDSERISLRSIPPLLSFGRMIGSRHLSFGHDFLMAMVAFVLAFAFRYGQAGLQKEELVAILYGAPFYGLVFSLIAMWVGLNRRLWRYATVDDLKTLVIAASAAVMLVFLSFFLITRMENVPRSVPLMLWVVTLAMVGGPRFLVRALRQTSFPFTGQAAAGQLRVPIMLVGTGPETELFLRWTRMSRSCPHQPVAVLDIQGASDGFLIDGVPVVGPLDNLEHHLSWLEQKGRKPLWLVVDNVLPVGMMTELTMLAGKHNIKIAKMPSLAALQDTNAEQASSDLRPIAIEDLLGRSQIDLDMHSLRTLIIGRRILVTGGGGTIGSELCRQILRHDPKELLVLDASEFNLYSIEHELVNADKNIPIIPLLVDVRDRHSVMSRLNKHKPELIFHAAALKHVPMVEANPVEAVATNVLGTRNIADAAEACGAIGMVLISTDKAVNPTSVMGATKRLAEQYCQSRDAQMPNEGAATRFVVVRFGNVLGSSGSVVPLFEKQLAAGGPITITHPDITRYFMTVHEAAQLVLQAATLNLCDRDQRGDVVVLDMGEPIGIYDLACHMTRLAGLEPERDIKIETVGLRPGEKLYEELFGATETEIPARIAGLKIARSKLLEPDRLEQALRQLTTAKLEDSQGLAISTLVEFVDGFQREAIDHKAA